MKAIVLAVLLVALLAVPAMAYDWVTSPINGHKYTLVDCSSWTDAENQAVALGGNLATVRNEAENDWIYHFALDEKSDCCRLWIGLCRPVGSSGPAPGYGWTWISGEPVTFTKWASWMDPSHIYVPGDHGLMFIRYYNHNADEELSSWAPERSYGAQYVMTTGVVEVVPEPSSFLVVGVLLPPVLFAFRRRRK